MHRVGDVGKHGVKLSSGRGMVQNIRRCLWVELYRNSVRNSVITLLYSVSLGEVNRCGHSVENTIR